MGFRLVAAGIVTAFSTGLPLAASAATDLGTLATGGDPIVLELSASPGSEIAVEVDGVDVTEFVTFEDGALVIDGNAPLSAGLHDITVYTLTDAGYEVLGDWQVTVERGVVLTSLTVSATHELEARVLNDESDEIARSFGQAEAEFFDGALSGSVGYIASTNPVEQPTGKTVDLEQYLLQFRHSTGVVDLSARLGHQDFDFDDVMVSDLNRRGLGLQVETGDQRMAFGIFGAAAVDMTGAENFTGLSEADSRIEGYFATLRPFAGNDLRLSLIGQRARGIAFGATDVGSGDGAAIALDGSAAEGRLRYAISAGQTDWDEDAEAAVFASERGRALAANLAYDLADGNWNNYGERSLTVGALYERVEDSFMSLANPGLAAGQERVRLTADYATEQLSLTLAGERQETNVGGPPTLETDEIYTYELNGSFTPATSVTAFGSVGTSYWDFGLVYSTQNRLETPPMAADPADFASAELSFGYSQQFDYWSWRLGYSYIDYDDQSAFDIDNTSHRVDGTLDWSNDSGASLNAYAAVDFIEDDLGDHIDTQVSLTGGYEFNPLWSANASLTRSSAQSSYGSDGVSVTGDVIRKIGESAELVISAGYSTDDLAAETPEDEEWFAGLLLRLRTDIFR